jgi:hypothetical protein
MLEEHEERIKFYFSIKLPQLGQLGNPVTNNKGRNVESHYGKK